MSYQEGGIPVAREGELYSLKWHTFQSHFTSGLPGLLFDGGHLTDVTLVAEGRSIKSHRLLLSLCSPHFKQLFHANSGAPNATTIIILNNVKFKDLEHVLQFIYNGEVKVSNNHELQGFLQTGELLQIEGLVTQNSNNAETDTQSSREPIVSTNNITQPDTLPRVIPTQPPQLFRRSQAATGPSTVTTPIRTQSHTSAPPSKTSMPPAKRPKFSASATATNSTFNNTMTSDISSMEVQVDPLTVSMNSSSVVVPTTETDPLMDELIGVHSRHGDEEEEEEQMIQIDAIKSEGEIYVHDERSEEDETFEVKEHDTSSLGVDVSPGGGMYSGGAVDDLHNLPGTSSGINASGAHLPKPPVLQKTWKNTKWIPLELERSVKSGGLLSAKRVSPKRKTGSVSVWKFYKYDYNLNKSICNVCGFKLSGKIITNLRKHLKSRHNIALLCNEGSS